MRKRSFLIALAMAAVFCLFLAAACTDPGTQPGGGNGGGGNGDGGDQPTLQQQFEQFGQKLGEAGSFEVRADVVVQGESREIVLSVEGNRVYESMPIQGTLFEYYLFYKDGFIYELAYVGGQKDQSNLYYENVTAMDAAEAVDMIASQMLFVPDFYGQILENAVFGAESITFAFPGAVDGTITLEEGGMQIGFVSESLGEIGITIGKVGENAVDFGELTEEDFTSEFSAYDRIFAEMEWVMASDTATVTAVQTTGGESTTIRTEYYAGEMLRNVYSGAEASGQPSLTEAYLRGDGGFVDVVQTSQSDTPPLVVGPNWEGGRVADIFEPFGVTQYLFSETYFDLAADSDEKVVLSEAGKEAYPACTGLLIDLSEEGKYTVSIAFRAIDGYNFPDTAEITIRTDGAAKPEFPEEFLPIRGWMQGGVLYGDGGDGQARAQGLAPDLGYVVLPESIEVNGDRYTVRTLSNGFTTGDEVLEYIVIPRSVVDIGGLRYAYNLGCLYYGGTAEEFEAVTGPVPYGTDVYFYSESEPTASGRYWHWNEAGNVPEPWPTSFSENFAARVQEIAGEDSFTFQLSLGKNGYTDSYTFRRDGQLLAMETSAADGYGYYQDGYVYAMSETAPGEYGRTISRAAEAELCVPGLTDLTMWDMLNVENLYSAAVEQVSESGEPTFSIAYPGREGTFIVSDGSISLPADGLVLSCRAYNVFEASYRPEPYDVVITISGLGSTQVQLPDDLSVSDFTANVTEIDLFLADLSAFLNADTGKLKVTVLASGVASEMRYAFSDGEMLSTLSSGGTEMFYRAVTERGYRTFIDVSYSDMTQMSGSLTAKMYGDLSGMQISDADIFVTLGLGGVVGSDLSGLKDSFYASGGGSYSLNEEALAALSGVEELSVTVDGDGVSVIYLHGVAVSDGAGRVDIEVTIEAEEIGGNVTIEFPSDVTSLADSYYEAMYS